MIFADAGVFERDVMLVSQRRVDLRPLALHGDGAEAGSTRILIRLYSFVNARYGADRAQIVVQFVHSLYKHQSKVIGALSGTYSCGVAHGACNELPPSCPLQLLTAGSSSGWSSNRFSLA